MSKYDPEELLYDIKRLLVANLNTKIAAIEAEKEARGFPACDLKPVSISDGYFQQSWSDKILNITPAIFFGIEDITTEGMGPVTKKDYKVFVEIVLVSQNDTLANTRILRYARAIEEVFTDNFASLSNSNQTKIETLRPVSFKLEGNSSEEIRVGGVSISTTLA